MKFNIVKFMTSLALLSYTVPSFNNITSAKLLKRQQYKEAEENLCKKWVDFAKESDDKKKILDSFLGDFIGSIQPGISSFNIYYRTGKEVEVRATWRDVFEQLRNFMKSHKQNA